VIEPPSGEEQAIFYGPHVGQKSGTNEQIELFTASAVNSNSCSSRSQASVKVTDDSTSSNHYRTLKQLS